MSHTAPVGVAVGNEFYFDADEHRPPRGVTLNLLTLWGRACQGVWVDNGGLVGWAPLHRIPPGLKEKMYRRQRPCTQTSATSSAPPGDAGSPK